MNARGNMEVMWVDSLYMLILIEQNKTASRPMNFREILSETLFSQRKAQLQWERDVQCRV